MSKELIRLSDCFMKFDDDVILDHINLYINDKEFLTLLGPSGCGKTTTLRIIGGFQKPTSGDVFFDGVRINDVPPHKRKVNTVFQKYALFTHMNIFENVAFGLRISKVPEAELRERVEEALALVNLAGYGKRSVNSLSGGQQQRVAIARAIVNRPQVLLLDEPLGALDLKLRKDMQIELKRIQQRTGITFIYVTHDQEEALTMSDRVIIVNGGRIEQDDPPARIYQYPRSRFAASFIGENNFFPLPDDDSRLLSVRPQFINVCALDDKERKGPEPFHTGTIEQILFCGTFDKLFIRLDDSRDMVTAYQYYEDYRKWSVEDRVGIWWNTQDGVQVTK